MNENTIGKNIKKIRKEKGLTQKELANKLKVSEPMISQYESKKTLKLETIRKIAKALGVSMSEIIGENWGTFSIEDFRNDFIQDEEKKYCKELNKRKITFIYELLGELFKRNQNHPINLNDTNGLNIFLNRELKEYQTLNNDELIEIESDIFDYLEFTLERYLKNKEIIKK